MSLAVKNAPVAAGQKVAANHKEPEAKKPFVVNWNRTSATIGQTVGITGTVNIVVKNQALITVDVLHNGKVFASAEMVSVKGEQLTAQWKVKPYKAGTFKEGVYDVEVRYNGGVPGKTSVPLRIVEAVVSGDYFG